MAPQANNTMPSAYTAANAAPFPTGEIRSTTVTPPPPAFAFVQATANDQKLTEPTPSVAWTRALPTRHTVHGTCGKTWCTERKTKGHTLLHHSSIRGFFLVQTKMSWRSPLTSQYSR